MIVCVCLRCDAVGVLFLEMGRCLVEKSKKGPCCVNLQMSILKLSAVAQQCCMRRRRRFLHFMSRRFRCFRAAGAENLSIKVHVKCEMPSRFFHVEFTVNSLNNVKCEISRTYPAYCGYAPSQCAWNRAVDVTTAY